MAIAVLLALGGASTGGVGINTNGVLTATKDVNLAGTSSGTSANAHGVMLTGNVKSNDGSVNITGKVTGAYAEGDVVTLTINGKPYTGLAAYQAAGGYALLRDCVAGRRTADEVIATLEAFLARVEAEIAEMDDEEVLLLAA